jgi:RNA polymerase sigma-70 factor (ECF subfamily)
MVSGVDAKDPDALVQALVGGDASALGPLFEQQRERLRRMLQFRLDPRLQGRIDAEDVLQEAFLAARQRLSAFDPALGPFHVWLRLVVQQTLIDVHRRHIGASMRNAGREAVRPQSASLSGFLAAQRTSPSQAAMRDELCRKLDAALASMDEIDREVLVLRHFEELSNKETAEVLGIQENAASNRYVRALARLKGLLGGFDPA